MKKIVRQQNYLKDLIESQENQDAVTVTQSGNEITITGDLAALNTFASTNTAQGSGKWIGLDLDTGLDTIVGATWNGSPLTQADVDEAASVGLGAGHIIFWVKAEALPKRVTIGAEGKENVTIKVSFADTGA